MQWEETAEIQCPIARTLAVVGDRWTMLIIRELFMGSRRFEDFEAQLGASPNLLSTRLKRLEQDGVIRRQAYSEHPPRHDYRLTEKGLDLYPLLRSLSAWGEKWAFPAGDAPSPRTIHRGCGHETGFAITCTACGSAYGARDIEAQPDPTAVQLRAQRRDAFNNRKNNNRR